MTFFERYYSTHGVRLVKQASIAALEGKGTVHSVLLVDGRSIPSDLVVAGIGAIPNTTLCYLELKDEIFF